MKQVCRSILLTLPQQVFSGRACCMTRLIFLFSPLLGKGGWGCLMPTQPPSNSPLVRERLQTDPPPLFEWTLFHDPTKSAAIESDAGESQRPKSTEGMVPGSGTALMALVK